MANMAYKIVSKVNWSNFIKTGAKECKGFDNDLKDGFIHLSTHEQLYPTFVRKYGYFSSVDSTFKRNFNLLAIDLNTSENVKWEKAKNGIVYPHLYSPIILDRNLLWVYGLENYQFNANGL